MDVESITGEAPELFVGSHTLTLFTQLNYMFIHAAR